MPAANAAQCAVLQSLDIDDRTLVTPRESEVLLWVAQGKANAGIAITLGCAENTVEVHLASIFEKLGFENRNAAAVRALEVMSSPTAKPRDTGKPI